MKDTNTIQYDLCKCLAHAGNFTVVGDPDQSIYSWRQADVRGFSKLLGRFFPGAVQIFLEDNYRSTPNILDLSIGILEEDKMRIKKTLRTTNPRGPPVPFLVEDSPEGEAYRIALEIERMYRVGARCLDLGDFAVLTRINAMSRPLEEVFNRVGIPYRIVGGLKFFERMEVQDCIAYLKLTHNLNDDNSFERIINVPKRRVGPALVATMKQRAIDKGVSLFHMLYAECTARKKSKEGKLVTPEMKHFVLTMRTLHDDYSAPTTEDAKSVQKLLERVLTSFRYKEYLEESYKKDHTTRWENVQELINFTTRFDSQTQFDEAARQQEAGVAPLPSIPAPAPQESLHGESEQEGAAEVVSKVRAGQRSNSKGQAKTKTKTKTKAKAKARAGTKARTPSRRSEGASGTATARKLPEGVLSGSGVSKSVARSR